MRTCRKFNQYCSYFFNQTARHLASNLYIIQTTYKPIKNCWQGSSHFSATCISAVSSTPLQSQKLSVRQSTLCHQPHMTYVILSTPPKSQQLSGASAPCQQSMLSTSTKPNIVGNAVPPQSITQLISDFTPTQLPKHSNPTALTGWRLLPPAGAARVVLRGGLPRATLGSPVRRRLQESRLLLQPLGHELLQLRDAPLHDRRAVGGGRAGARGVREHAFWNTTVEPG